VISATSAALRRARVGGAAWLALAAAGATDAQVVSVLPSPQVGSSSPITAAPPVRRPHTRPCVVPLFQDLAFADSIPKVYHYAPPAGCPGPWAKVVLTADFTVTAGRQFDRTAAFYLGRANIYYGTTAEPRAALSPSWHVERDVTDLGAIFASAQTGEANIGNFLGTAPNGVNYDGIIYASAALEFYPASAQDPVPRIPDAVVPVNGSGGDAGELHTTAGQISQTLHLPRNTERVYLDLIAQSQSQDEFWYLCVPSDQARNLESCGNTSFREAEVTLDGQPAGVAPVYPWIYTGGIDPFLWEPIPAVQTLDFRPYRVDLTPFAGVLADGNPHVLAVSVYNANGHFLATANLLAYTDHGRQHVSGGLLSNTLGPPAPVLTENIRSDPGGPTFTGSILVTSHRAFAISGYVDTSHGRVLTTVEQSIGFMSRQEFNVSPSTDIHNTQQTTRVDSLVRTRTGADESVSEQHFSYPLTLNYSFVVHGDGTATQVTMSDQRDLERSTRGDADGHARSLDNHVHATDTLQFDTSLHVVGNSGSQTTQSYRVEDFNGDCYSRTLTAQAQRLVAVQDGQGCPGR
jgi:hypothetical protein